MVNTLVYQYRRVDQWLRDLPRAWYVLLVGVGFFATWIGLSLILGGEPLYRSILLGGIGAFTFASVYYFLGPR